MWQSDLVVKLLVVVVFFIVPNFALANSVKVSASVTTEVKVEINPDFHAEREALKEYTGLIIDCRGLGLQRAMSPVIKNENGEIIYGNKNLNPDRINEIGMVAYAPDIQETERAGENPLVIKAKTLNNFNSNPVLTNADASRAIIANEVCGFLDNLSVVFLTDSVVEEPTDVSMPLNDSASNISEVSDAVTPLDNYTTETDDKNIEYTGIIIDCRGFGLKTAASPVIKSESGKIIYGDKDLDFDKINEIGMAEYTTSIKASVTRTGEHPFIVRAVKLDKFKTSPILSNKDAERVILANEVSGFFKELNVVFLTDETTEEKTDEN